MVGDDADELFEAISEDPLRVVQTATERLHTAPPAESCQLHRVLGNAYRELRQTALAVEHHEEALKIAAEIGDTRLEGLALMSLAGSLTFSGEFDRSVALVDRSVGMLEGDEHLTALNQQACIYLRAGRSRESLACFNRALALAETASDRTIAGELYMNRSLYRYYYESDIDQAENDAVEALAIFAGHGRTKRVADLQHNLAWLAGRRGDIITALDRFEEAESTYAQAGVPSRAIFPDKCEVLMAAGLSREALDLAERSSRLLGSDGDFVDQAEALILVAGAALLAGEADRAREAAEAAAALFHQQGLDGWAANARVLEVRARLSLGTVGPDDRALALAATADDRQAMNHVQAEAMLVAAEVALALDAPASAERDLSDLDPADLGVVASFHRQYLLARCLEATGEVETALRSCQATMDDFAQWAAVLGGTELRANVAQHIAAVAELGVRLALQVGHPELLMTSVEQERAFALAAPPVHPPPDAALAQDLLEMRSALRQIEADLEEGFTDSDSRARLATARRRVTDRARKLASSPRVEPAAGAAASAHVSFTRSHGRLHAIVGHGGTLAVGDLGPLDRIDACARALRRELSLHVAAVGGGRERSDAALFDLTNEIDALLFPSGAAGADGDGRLVICPDALTYDLPWGLLPTLHPVPHVVAPSLMVHNRCFSVPVSRGSVMAAAGPGLQMAEAEVRSVGGVYPSARILVGDRATVDETLGALAVADVAHLACHGRFADESPMFSSLELHDGPLFVHELERLRPCPSAVVLSACHGGRHGSPSSRELLGLTTSLLAAGARSVVAASTALPDTGHVATLMARLHEAIAHGEDLANALLGIRQRDRLLGGLLVCHGAG